MKGNKTILIVEVDPETHKYFVERARMKVGWKNCPVYDHVNVTRCYKCWGFILRRNAETNQVVESVAVVMRHGSVHRKRKVV